MTFCLFLFSCRGNHSNEEHCCLTTTGRATVPGQTTTAALSVLTAESQAPGWQASRGILAEAKTERKRRRGGGGGGRGG